MTTSCGYRTESQFSLPCKEDGQLTCEGKCWQHCSVARGFYSQQSVLFRGGYPRWKIDQDFAKIMDEWIDHAVACHHQPDNRLKKYPNGKYNGPFAFTMTMSPSDGLSEDEMMDSCRKIMEQKSQPVKKFAWYLEYKDAEAKSHPHIHGMYETENGRRIEKKHWQRRWKIWDESIPLGAGFRGGYHRPIRSDEAYSQYIRKGYAFGDSNL